jgi:hypothetical protein
VQQFALAKQKNDVEHWIEFPKFHVSAGKKYIQYQVHPPFTSIYYYIHLYSAEKKDFSYAIAKNGKYMKMRNTHAIPKHNSTST